MYLILLIAVLHKEQVINVRNGSAVRGRQSDEILSSEGDSAMKSCHQRETGM
jgi:hypothetical protein